MNTPSIKTLREIFGDNAGQAKAIIEKGKFRLHAGPTLQRLNDLGDSNTGAYHGVEYCETVNGEYAGYLNAGDCYIATLIYWRGSYRVQDLVTFIEIQERRGIKFK